MTLSHFGNGNAKDLEFKEDEVEGKRHKQYPKWIVPPYFNALLSWW